MATKQPFLRVPVDTLGVTDGPSYSNLKAHQGTIKAQGFEARLELKTSASERTFKRTVLIWAVVTYEDDHSFAGRMLRGQITFRCEIEGVTFSGSYDVLNRNGTLERET